MKLGLQEVWRSEAMNLGGGEPQVQGQIDKDKHAVLGPNFK